MDGMGEVVVDRGLADSPRCQHPSESPGVTWEQGKTREIQGRGRRGGGEGVGTGSRSLACHPPALEYIPRHLPPSFLHLLWMQMCDPAAGA